MKRYQTIIRHNRPDANGLCMIYFRFGSTWVSTGLKIEPKYFDSSTGTIKSSYKKFFIISPQLNSYKSRAEQYISNNNINDRVFNLEDFKQFVFYKKDTGTLTIVAMFNEFILHSNISLGRSKHYKVVINDLQAFKKNAKLTEVDFSFATNFQNFLRKKGNIENTIVGKIKMLKAVIHYAMKKNIIKDDPLSNVRLSESKPMRTFLTEHELELLESYYKKTKISRHKKVLQYFLFSCYTGLRYSDIVKLHRNDINADSLYITQQKTNKTILVPLIDEAKQLIDYSLKGLIFDTMTNQKSNLYIKEVAGAVGISKDVSYHASRHTFATLAIFYGMREEVIAEILGVDMKTIKVYAKIMPQVKFTEMAKWGKTQQRS